MAEQRYKIGDIAALFSIGQWEKRFISPAEVFGKYAIFVPNRPDGIRLDVRMLRSEQLTQSGFVIALKDDVVEKVDPFYLGFELASIISNVVLLYDREKKNYKSRITKKGLTEFEIQIPDMDRQISKLM